MNGVLIYTTLDGDRWDTIAHKHYGTAFEIDRLIAANPHLPFAEQFESGLTVFIPVIQQKIQRNQEKMPPWMR
ncbi:tail protein X [Kingella kingae]|uniref:tail protein X n=1 Tax=Kingella kingae TaxID=504 RepID=UPI00254F89FA|nr:tail protein X [Kingella kingae]MDK4535724.1 tail protein X [Kingella kingae]MDK4537913.1 tail protein X [Kingella kingae]MDK4545594.1 tail protein X [Kingella kingae]MDK4547054.1 tail protein X [Kingella kingae]MDK4567526.1 tail protein X [Kingella kingae]